MIPLLIASLIAHLFLLWVATNLLRQIRNRMDEMLRRVVPAADWEQP
jgi:hypothetical protein